MKILLTGANGMVGRSIKSHKFYEDYDWLIPGSDSLNLLDYSTVHNFISSNKPDMIVHAAGRVGGIQANLRDGSRFLLDNLDMGRNVLLSAAIVGVPRLINLSSTCVYPRDREEALSERDILTGPLEPTNEGYALAKIAVMRLAELLSRENSDLSYKTLISSNLYGPHDKFDATSSHMIPAVISKLHSAVVKKDKTVEIWGAGTARREFLYVDDLANAIYRAIEHFDTLPRLMNVGLGFDYTINEYYEKVAEIVGYKGAFTRNLDMPVGMSRKLANIDLARKWGWNPTYSIEKGIELTYEFYKKEGYRQVL